MNNRPANNLRHRASLFKGRRLFTVVYKSISNALPNQVIQWQWLFRNDAQIPLATAVQDLDVLLFAPENLIVRVKQLHNQSPRSCFRFMISNRNGKLVVDINCRDGLTINFALRTGKAGQRCRDEKQDAKEL